MRINLKIKIMNDAHFHLLVNHLPILVPILGLIVLLGGFIFRSAIVKRVGYVLFIIGAIATLPSMFSGEGAEEVVENIPGVTENFIEEHEEIAETFALLSYILGAVSLLALWANWKQKGFAAILSYVVLVLSIFVIYFGKVTGTTGGEIRHTEIRANQTEAQQTNSTESSESEEDED